MDIQDFRYAVRVCLRAPAFTSVAVLTLAIGIGANSAIFTIVDAVLLRPLPFKAPDRLVALWEENARRPGRPNVVAPANFLRWRERTTAFQSLAAFAETRANLTGGRDPEEVAVQNVTAPFFATLGVEPLLGRWFSNAEDSDPNSGVAILSYGLWQRRFGGDPSIVGQMIQLNARATTIVGVMPEGFGLGFRSGALVGKTTDVWVPFVLPPSAREPHGRFLSVVARLKPGRSVRDAQTELASVMSALATEFPKFDTAWTAQVVPLRDELSRQVRPALLVLFGAVAFVLLIACANVANLLLARGSARQREFAIRAALGAGRMRIVRQLLTEMVLLATAGAALGLLLAAWMLAGLAALSPIEVASAGALHLNRAVLAFTVLVAMAATIVAGLAPALETSRSSIANAAQEGGRQVGGSVRAKRWRDAFVIAEIALAVVLLVGAGLLLRSFAMLSDVNPGFDPSNVLTMRIQLPPAKYQEDPQITRFFADAVARVRDLAGVRAAGVISYLPFAGLGAATNMSIAGQAPPPPGQDLIADVRVCDDGYFQAMRIPLVRGRLFTEREEQRASNVVVVNETLVRRYFPNDDPIGKRLLISMTDPLVPTEIIGVVGDAHFTDLATPPRPMAYWPHPQLPYSTMTLTVRTTGDPLSYAPAVTRQIRALDKDQPVSDVRSMEQWVARSVAQARFNSTVLAAFAGIAVLLAALGIYGVLAYVVTQRTGEIGVRLALGAATRDIVGMVVADGLRVALIGLAIGAVMALALTRAVSALLFATRPTDPLTFAGVVVVLGLVAGVASYIPARRAARVQPGEALRYQ